jgi:hypothetical protein
MGKKDQRNLEDKTIVEVGHQVNLSKSESDSLIPSNLHAEQTNQEDKRSEVAAEVNVVRGLSPSGMGECGELDKVEQGADEVGPGVEKSNPKERNSNNLGPLSLGLEISGGKELERVSEQVGEFLTQRK